MSYLLRASALIVVDSQIEVKYREAVILARGPQAKRLPMRERTHSSPWDSSGIGWPPSSGALQMGLK